MNERLLNKLGRLKEYIALVESLKPDCQNKFTLDPIYRGAILHYLYLMADTCVSIAEMVIRQKELRLPQYYQESFDILGEAGVLDPEFAYSFAKIAGFRNFLAHDYEDVDAKQICGEILGKIPEVKRYIEMIKAA